MVNLLIVRKWRYIKPYLEFCEENSKASGGDLDALFDALNGSTSERNGLTVAVNESDAPSSGSGGMRGTKRGLTAALAKPSAEEEPSEASRGASSSDTIGDDMNSAG